MKTEGKTTPELVAMQTAIMEDPASKNPKGGLRIYTPAAERKLDKIARAITANLMDRRIALGLPINCDGYSGRQTNRRR